MSSEIKVEKKKSVGINMFLNAFRGMLNVLFPLITFPYISRILGVENIGKYNFANSIISYFILIAGLGINTYAIRTGASLREDKVAFKKFAEQVFTINIIATIVSYMLLGVTMVCVTKFQDYKDLLLILSVQIAFKTIGVEWIYSVYEDYAYITKRSIFFQILSLILMFLFVKTEQDVGVYAIIVVLSAVGSNIINFFHAKKYCGFLFTFHPHLKMHLKPILVFFATTVTVTIYVSSDTTILGFFCDDYTVGVYSVAVKVYTILKSVLSSAIVVAIPRMSAYWNQGNRKKFEKLGREVYQIFLTFIIPAIIGVILLSRDIIMIMSGSEYVQAQSSLIILCMALFFCLGAGFWSQGVMIPGNQEKKVFNITVISAIINIVLNILLIPFMKENAAALTTMIAEGVVFWYCRKEAVDYIKMSGVYTLLAKIFMGCVPMVIFGYIFRLTIENIFIRVALTVIFGGILYLCIEFMIKNDIVIKFKNKLMKIKK